MSKKKGYFTLPGESGYEKLTLELADTWGADVIRDSDGTELSKEIIDAGYGIYSTICIIRNHNEWAKEHKDKLQECFLMTEAKLAREEICSIKLMESYSDEQFLINDTEYSKEYWQVFDRTTNTEIPKENWIYEKETQAVHITQTVCWHKYTVSFLAYRIWEEISMYNHITNGWEKEHLMQIDPRYSETQDYILKWIRNWCKTHPDTTVVRFTSMFYNFAWIWGSSERNRYLFTDWASYDFTVSPLSLKLFEKKYGYKITAEDFVNKGKRQVTHMPAAQPKLDWMEFVNDFVISFGRQLVDIVHEYGKEAYVFYDDSWVGIEPYHDRFAEFGFDGIIKAVFCAFEARLCSGVKIKVHELRMHPYLFPTAVNGEPSFLPGGNPTLEAKKYWKDVRRGILRAPVERIGLGGYLHLVEKYPDFVAYIEKIANEFRTIREFHKHGTPYVLKPKIAILHFWGKLRSWTLSGHFHESHTHDLIHVIECLAGLPFEVDFIGFKEVKKGAIDKYDVIINAGSEGSAWSGGDEWRDEEVVSEITRWTYEGGTFIGINQPSAVNGFDTYFRMAHVLGVDQDKGARVGHGKWSYNLEEGGHLFPKASFVKPQSNLFLTNGKAQVLAEKDSLPTITSNCFGKGKGIYMASFQTTMANNRMLLNILLFGAGESLNQNYLTDSVFTECTYYPKDKTMVVINNSETEQTCNIKTDQRIQRVYLNAFETKIIGME